MAVTAEQITQLVKHPLERNEPGHGSLFQLPEYSFSFTPDQVIGYYDFIFGQVGEGDINVQQLRTTSAEDAYYDGVFRLLSIRGQSPQDLLQIFLFVGRALLSDIGWHQVGVAKSPRITVDNSFVGANAKAFGNDMLVPQYLSYHHEEEMPGDYRMQVMLDNSSDDAKKITLESSFEPDDPQNISHPSTSVFSIEQRGEDVIVKLRGDGLEELKKQYIYDDELRQQLMIGEIRRNLALLIYLRTWSRARD